MGLHRRRAEDLAHAPGAGRQVCDVAIIAEQNGEKGKNWLEIAAKPAPPQGAEPVWHCDVVIRHVDGEDRWGWGVSFLMKARNHSVIRNSFRCTGSG